MIKVPEIIRQARPSFSPQISMQCPGEQPCIAHSLPATEEDLIGQDWTFPIIVERTPEATSAPRLKIPKDLLGEGTGGTVYRRILQLPQCTPPCPQCPAPQLCAVKRLGRNSVGQVLYAHAGERRHRESSIMQILGKTRVCFAYSMSIYVRAEFSSYFTFEIRNGIAIPKTLSLDINLLSHFMETTRKMISFTLLWSTCLMATLGTTSKPSGARVIQKLLLSKCFMH